MPKTTNPLMIPVISLLVGVMLLATGCDSVPAEANNAGNALAANGAYVEAVRAYQNAQVLDPNAAVPYNNAGIVLAQTDDLDGAARALEFALTTADAALIRDAYYNLGNVYFLAGRYGEAKDAFQALLRLDPEDSEARYNYELTLLYAVSPTPENQQQRNEPDVDQTDPEVTPTPQPNDQTGPTPTPPREDQPPDTSATPESGSGDFFASTPSTLVPQENGSLSVEEAEELLDLIEQEQQALPDYFPTDTPSGDSNDNDW